MTREIRFSNYIEERTSPDGLHLGSHFSLLFQVLNTDPTNASSNLDELLFAFTYVNGRLFEETLPIPATFDWPMRETLLDSCALDWS